MGKAPQFCERCGQDLSKMKRRVDLDAETVTLLQLVGGTCRTRFRARNHFSPKFNRFLDRFLRGEKRKIRRSHGA